MAQQRLFGKKRAVAPPPDNEILALIRRSRTLEGRYSNLERRSQVLEENLIAHNRKLSQEIRLVADDVQGVKQQVAELKDTMQSLISELRDFARIEEVEVIRKYLDYWDPVRFVTQAQVERIVNEILETN